MIGNKECEAKICVACKCECKDSGGHECVSCNNCSQEDEHKRKENPN